MGITYKSPEKSADHMKKVTTSEIRTGPGENEEFRAMRSYRKPGLNELPDLVKKAGHTEIPGILYGFKPTRIISNNGSTLIRKHSYHGVFEEIELINNIEANPCK